MLFDDLKSWAINTLGLSTLGQIRTEPDTSASPALHITAITAVNSVTVLQCWQIDEPVLASSQAGIEGATVMPLGAGENSNASLVRIPAKFDGGVHHAPALQYVVFLTGEAHVTIPDSTDSVLLKGGTGDSIIFAADTAEFSETGHRTEYPGDVETLAVPIKVGSMPKHTVLYSGPCAGQDSGVTKDEL